MYLARHGESTWNPTGRYQGRIDTELSELGQQQAELLAARLSAVPLSAVYSSPLQRAHDTAYAIAVRHGLAVHEEEALTEMDHGQWCGLLKAEVEHHFGPMLQRWYEHPAQVQMPGGESLVHVEERACAALQRIVAAHPGGSVAVCTHDVVLKVVVAQVLGLGLDQFWSLRLDNGSLSVVDYTERGASLAALNDTCHLGKFRSDISAQAL
ncbi:MAG: histidine phosphatase family protein [Chloroflexi bacterium]|nr:histidine phosphatase family protein [Chloroflexota bacterium]